VQSFNRITWNPNQMNGQFCIRGMRLTDRRARSAAGFVTASFAGAIGAADSREFFNFRLNRFLCNLISCRT